MTRTNMAANHLPASWMVLKGATEDKLEPTSTVKAIARIARGDDPHCCQRWITHLPSRYTAAFCQLAAFPASIFPAEKPRLEWRNGSQSVFTLNERARIMRLLAR